MGPESHLWLHLRLFLDCGLSFRSAPELSMVRRRLLIEYDSSLLFMRHYKLYRVDLSDSISHLLCMQCAAHRVMIR